MRPSAAPTSTTSRPSAMAPVLGVTRNADATSKRSSRIGFGVGTAPAGWLTVTVMFEYGPSRSAENDATSPFGAADAHGSVAPYRPVAQPTRSIDAGACTVAAVARVNTGQLTPLTFHTSSSWSGNAFSTPRMRYVMS